MYPKDCFNIINIQHYSFSFLYVFEGKCSLGGALAWKLWFELELGWSSQVWDYPGGCEGTFCLLLTWSASPLGPRHATAQPWPG